MSKITTVKAFSFDPLAGALFVSSITREEATKTINNAFKNPLIVEALKEAGVHFHWLASDAHSDEQGLVDNKRTESQRKLTRFLNELNQEELTELVDELAFSLLSKDEQLSNSSLTDKDGREIMEINCDCQSAQIEYLITHGYQLTS